MLLIAATALANCSFFIHVLTPFVAVFAWIPLLIGCDCGSMAERCFELKAILRKAHISFPSTKESSYKPDLCPEAAESVCPSRVHQTLHQQA